MESIQDSIDRQIAVYPHEKLHIHTDRDCYVPGEKIWFKAYPVDAITHQTPTKSRYIYVELINSSDTLVERVMVRQSADSMYYGHIFLSDASPEGYYTLRAYTRFMENMGDDYFFKKSIRIGKIVPGKDAGRKKKKRTAKDYEVTFYPEGGSLQEGKICLVAFKALNENGAAENITGTVEDVEGNVICDVNTYYSGMGRFSLAVEDNRDLYLKCKNTGGVEKKFKLPKAQNTCSIKVVKARNNLYVSVNKSPAYTGNQLHLLIHNRGRILYFAPWDETREYLVFLKKLFPAGISQLLLLDGNMNPLSERLIFSKTEDETKLAFSTGKTVYGKREKAVAEIHVTDSEGNAVSGNLSVAVTDDQDIRPDTAVTIQSTLLLSSELKGYIENPAYYLQDDPKADFALDLLMMVHGWRRYDLPEVIKGNIKYPETAFEKTKYITGQVKTLLREKPVDNGEILMFSSDGGFGMTTTNSLGYFSFYGFDIPDSVRFFVKASNKKGSERVLLNVPSETYPRLRHIPGLPDDFEDASGMDSVFIEKAEQRAQYDDDMRVINLPEVVVTAKRKVDKRDEARLQNWMNSSSDVTIYREDIEKRHALRVVDLLMGVAGVMVSGNGSISIRGGGAPLILIDGMIMEAMEGTEVLDMLNVDDVESIDVFKGPSAAIFGMRGGNGAISITTRRGSTDFESNLALNYASIAPLGFQKPVEFYSPKYDTPQEKRDAKPDYRTTIFWKPNVLISDEGKASFEFYTADFPTTYSVVIEGISSEGLIIRKTEKIVVGF
jgi:TonB-dependent SusC/RagA subfamily outer membrane receptor